MNQQPEVNSTQKKVGDMTLGDWMITMLITAIPFVGIVMIFIWAFGKPDVKRTYAQATLIWMAIAFLIGIVYGIIMITLFSAVTIGTY